MVKCNKGNMGAIGVKGGWQYEKMRVNKWTLKEVGNQAADLDRMK
jgi:hypothetical protein